MGFVKLARPRHIFSALMAVGLASVGMYVALRGLEWRAFQAQIHQLDWRWLAVGVFFDVASYVAQGVRWQRLLDGASIWQTTRAIYAGLFLNEVVPLRPGEAFRAWLASRDLRVGIPAIVPTIVTERLMDALWLAGALLAALAFVPLPPSLMHAAWIVIAAVAFLIAVAAVVGRKRYSFIRQVRSGLRNLPAVLASGCFLVSQGLAFWAVTRASHLSLGVIAAFVVMLIVRIGTMIPAAPANLGTHQFATILGLSLYAVPKTVAAGFSFIVFFILTVPLLTIGFVACLSVGLTWRSVRREIGLSWTANTSPATGYTSR